MDGVPTKTWMYSYSGSAAGFYFLFRGVLLKLIVVTRQTVIPNEMQTIFVI